MRSFPLLVTILVLLLALLQYELWFNPTGIVHLFQLHRDIAAQDITNHKLEERNHLLAIQVDHLKQGNEPVEGRARNELGMVKKNEVYYQIVDNEKD